MATGDTRVARRQQDRPSGMHRMNGGNGREMGGKAGEGDYRRDLRTRIVVAATMLLALTMLLMVTLRLIQPDSLQAESFYDPGATLGSYDGKSEDEIRAALDNKVAQGMFNISISSVIRFPNGSENEGIANITNIPENRYDMSVEIALADTGEVVYRSGAIEPGNYIDAIGLDVSLPAGTYDATAMFTAYNRDAGHTVQGTSGAEVKIVVY